MPEISVIVPVYNAEKTVGRCVNSIRKQTFSNLEIILVDDGSKDASGSLCDRLAEDDSRIRVCHKENGGVSSARNRGISLAKGTYIQFVDCDDYLPEDFCAALLEAQKKYGKDAFVWTALQIVSENGVVSEEELRYEETPCSFAGRRDVLKFSARYLLNSPVNKLYHGEIIRKTSLHMNEEISIAEDLLFNLEYLDAAGECPVVILNNIPYFYVRNGEVSLDHGYREGYYKIHKQVLGKLWNYCEKWEIPTEDRSLYYSRYWEYMMAALANNNCADSPLSFWQRIWENGKVYKDKNFQKSLKTKKRTMGRGSYFTMRTRSGIIVWLYEKVRQV